MTLFTTDPVIDWLLDSDPSIRWQVMRDLTDAPAEIVAAERARVAVEGWGPRILDQQSPDGNCGEGVATPIWWSNLYTKMFLLDLGVDPTSPRVRAAIELGLIEVKPGEDGQAVALLRTIDRQLQHNEVARFSPPEPAVAAIREEMTPMKARAGSRLPALVTQIGVDDAKLEQFARETLRIRAYMAQRFGTSGQATADEARRYYEEHAAEFTREGVRMPFEEAEPLARQRASADRLRATIEKWTSDLRVRADVVIVGGGAAPR